MRRRSPNPRPAGARSTSRSGVTRGARTPTKPTASSSTRSGRKPVRRTTGRVTGTLRPTSPRPRVVREAQPRRLRINTGDRHTTSPHPRSPRASRSSRASLSPRPHISPRYSPREPSPRALSLRASVRKHERPHSPQRSSTRVRDNLLVTLPERKHYEPPSLPPAVAGEVKGSLVVTVDHIFWKSAHGPRRSNYVGGAFPSPHVRVQWWGATGEGDLFRPAAHNESALRKKLALVADGGFNTVYFPVCCSPQHMFRYLHDSGVVRVSVFDASGDDLQGVAEIPVDRFDGLLEDMVSVKTSSGTTVALLHVKFAFLDYPPPVRATSSRYESVSASPRRGAATGTGGRRSRNASPRHTGTVRSRSASPRGSRLGGGAVRSRSVSPRGIGRAGSRAGSPRGSGYLGSPRHPKSPAATTSNSVAAILNRAKELRERMDREIESRAASPRGGATDRPSGASVLDALPANMEFDPRASADLNLLRKYQTYSGVVEDMTENEADKLFDALFLSGDVAGEEALHNKKGSRPGSRSQSPRNNLSPEDALRRDMAALRMSNRSAQGAVSPRSRKRQSHAVDQLLGTTQGTDIVLFSVNITGASLNPPMSFGKPRSMKNWYLSYRLFPDLPKQVTHVVSHRTLQPSFNHVNLIPRMYSESLLTGLEKGTLFVEVWRKEDHHSNPFSPNIDDDEEHRDTLLGIAKLRLRDMAQVVEVRTFKSWCIAFVCGNVSNPNSLLYLYCLSLSSVCLFPFHVSHFLSRHSPVFQHVRFRTWT